MQEKSDIALWNVFYYGTDFTTFYKRKSKEHDRAVHDKIKYKFCRMCDAQFDNTENLRDHIQSIHEKTKRFQCSFCTYGGNIKVKFIAHMREVHGESSCSESQTTLDKHHTKLS